MTFRTRTAPKPTRRRVRRNDSRRTIYLTITFTLAIVSAMSLLGGVFLASYYTDHGAPIAAVSGEAISKDAVRDRAHLDFARSERLNADYLTLRNQGKLTTEEYANLQTTIANDESASTIFTNALSELVDETELRQFAAKNGIVITDQMIDAQIKSDSTLAEVRNVKIIGVAPQPTPPANSPTASDDTDAEAKARAYLAEVQGGKAWDDVAKEAQSDAANQAGTIGPLGLVPREALNVDPDLADAIFALAKVNDVTAIFKGVDGAYRFATVTNIVPEYTDANWQSTIASTGGADQYRALARAEATQKAVQSFVEAKYISGPTVQRNVLEIAVGAGYVSPGNGDEVKIAMLVFAPNHDAASASSVATTDPAWADAKKRADAAVATLRADPSKFAAMAADTTVNDELHFNTVGGSIPWLPREYYDAQTKEGSTGLGLTSVEAAIFAPDLTPDSILDPIQEPTQGYVVVEFQARRPAPIARIADAALKINAGADFGTEAKSVSEAVDSPTGGDLGWVSPYMLSKAQEAAIWATPIGGVSNIVDDSGYFIFKVLGEETRTPDAAQQLRLKKVVYQRWVSDFQANALIWQDSAAVAALTPATPSP
jgi:parvulin-like peptidyl-prolyl isomerase